MLSVVIPLMIPLVLLPTRLWFLEDILDAKLGVHAGEFGGCAEANQRPNESARAAALTYLSYGADDLVFSSATR